MKRGDTGCYMAFYGHSISSAHMGDRGFTDGTKAAKCLSVYVCVCVCVFLAYSFTPHPRIAAATVCVCVCVCVCVRVRVRVRACLSQTQGKLSHHNMPS